MFNAAMQALICLSAPAFAIWLSKQNRLANALGPVVFCYVLGLLMANIPGAPVHPGVASTLSEAMIPLAIPLLLFSTHMGSTIRLARRVLFSFGLACLSVLICSYSIAPLFRHETEEFWKIAGMLVGVYTGGTPNMSAIGIALDVRKETFILLNTVDVVTGGTYLLLLLSIAQPLLRKLLPPFRSSEGQESGEADHSYDTQSQDTQAGHVQGISKAPAGLPSEAATVRPSNASSASTSETQTRARPWTDTLRSQGIALLAAVLVAGASAGITYLIFGKLNVSVVLLLLTSFGLLAALWPKVNQLEGSFELGEYLLLIFCVAVGSLADLSAMANASLILAKLLLSVMCSAVLLHLLLSMLFRIDTDTVIISSTAAIFGPAFIGPVAQAMKNRDLVAPGLAIGLLGIAMGNYLGIGLAYLLKP